MKIIRSLLITCFISLFFSFGLKGILGFWEVFSIACGLQIAIAFIYNSIKISKQEKIRSIHDQEIEELLALNDVDFLCPCGNFTFSEKIFPNLDNVFKCDKCSNTIRVDVKMDPILLTEDVSEVKTYDRLKQVSEKEL